ncbi:biliverdin-producing heme oxygenase [Scleromatobacter humisilvae]|uniref:Biliverdin-producing heme oxygenase n=1 Tax=Scleromatobacter humisilvae TaxID=2897159 RepID=A0A9X1YIB7_9BURK|nr:biliverdin-producing heme oxygenase [Scleromatobacter humisilvae]MCK9686247.1 biliverdin-producing heme oxygenase [Scleromatobacter humisilvae]
MSSENALAELRLTTRAEHERIEHVLRLDQPMPLERYGAILCGFDAFLRAWEPRVHAALPERLQPWFRARRRGGFASADVEWLRAVAGVGPVAMSSRLAATLPLGDPAEAMGSLYVIEGSALGGRVIAPQLKRTLGLDQGRGASYFHGFGGETGAMWANFRTQAALEIGDSSGNTARACRSAKRTFAALIELFSPLAPPEPEQASIHVEPSTQIAPALLMAYGALRAESTGPEPAPLADIHIDLPDKDESGDEPTLVELPMDGGEDDGGDTQRMPL